MDSIYKVVAQIAALPANNKKSINTVQRMPMIMREVGGGEQVTKL